MLWGEELETKILSSLGKIAGVAGIALGVFFLLFRSVLQEQILHQAPSLNSSQAFAVVFSVMILTFGISGVGVVAWLISRSVGPSAPVSMTAIALLAALLVLVLGAALYVAAQTPLGPLGAFPDGTVLKEIPTAGLLTPGTKVFVDDQTCPKDQIKRITSGDAAVGLVRKIACVPRKCAEESALLHTSQC